VRASPSKRWRDCERRTSSWPHHAQAGRLSEEVEESVDRATVAAGDCDWPEGVLLTHLVLGAAREPQPISQQFHLGTNATSSLFGVKLGLNAAFANCPEKHRQRGRRCLGSLHSRARMELLQEAARQTALAAPRCSAVR
jgi:hypothetical protein